MRLEFIQALEALGSELAIDAALAGPYFARAQAVKNEKGVPLYEVSNGLAVIGIEGPLAKKALAFKDFIWWDGYDRIGQAVEKAANDSAVSVVGFRIDSPGAAAGLSDGGNEMRAILDASGKPSIAYLELGASAAYWLACVADEIYVPTDGAAGSIGTNTSHLDLSRMLDKMGVTITRIQDPEGKTAGDWIKPLDDEARARLQEVVSMYSTRFYDHVAARRGMTPKAVRELNAKVFYGQNAVNAKLADGVLSWSGVVKRAISMAQKRKDKRMSDLAAFLGLAADASTEDIKRASAEAKPVLTLGRNALQLTGEKSPDAAAGILVAWKQDSAEAATLRAERLAEQKAAEANERQQLLAQLAQVEPPALVWKEPGNPKAGPVQEYAEMSTGALRAYVGRRTKSTVPAALRPAIPVAANGEPSEADVAAYAKENNVTPFVARAALRQLAQKAT
ncbi:MAG: S49 family peptidase [Polyangiaceae bacterium]|nr:S49 family peptidase [Polyangiaceae bacterium]